VSILFSLSYLDRRPRRYREGGRWSLWGLHGWRSSSWNRHS